MATFLQRMNRGIQAAMSATTVQTTSVTPLRGKYDLLMSFYDGSWRRDPAILTLRDRDPRLYRYTRLVYNLSRAVVRLYAQTVYQGDLSTDGQPLSDGTRGAIPIDPQTGKDSTDQALVAACAGLWQLWNWKMWMSHRPKMAAIYGDVLTELIDDLESGKVVPVFVYPGDVVDIQLDASGNVKRYAIEKNITVAESDLYGEPVKAESYVYRKEVTSRDFRYYKDGAPFGYGGDAVVPNPYGFAPAIWDRHEIQWGERGLGAIEPAISGLFELNNTLSQSLDHMRKEFGKPVMVSGSMMMNPADRMKASPNVVHTTLRDPEPDDFSNDPYTEYMFLAPQSQLMASGVDIPGTVNLVKALTDTMASEFPESMFVQEILKMSQVTGPGIEKAMGPIIGLVKAVRSGQDINSVKLFQMAITMMAVRLKANDFPLDRVAARKDLYDLFAPYDAESYKLGVMDMSIPDRDVIPSTIDDVVDRLEKIEALTSEWALRRAGVDEDGIAEIMGARKEAADRLAEQLAAPVDDTNTNGEGGTDGNGGTGSGGTEAVGGGGTEAVGGSGGGNGTGA